MNFRFVFQGSGGEEVKVPSLEVLTRYVENGVIGEHTLLYDSCTREWAPARTHPVFRLITEEVGADASPPAPRAPDREEESKEGEAILDVVLTPMEGEDEDTVKAFLEARERERIEDGMRESSESDDLHLVGGAEERLGRLASGAPHLEAPPPEADVPAPWAPEAAVPQSRPVPPAPWGAGVAEPERAPASSSFRSPRRRGRRREGGERSRGSAAMDLVPLPDVRQASLVALLLGVGGWGIADAWTMPVQSDRLTGDPVPVTAPPRPAGPLVSSVRSVDTGAFQDMALGMEALRREIRLGDPPAVWMAGQYVAEAAAYPEVESYWERYLTFVETLREREEDLYRSGLVRRLEAAGIQGTALSVRLARGMQDFRAGDEGREERYAAMEELGDAALGLHGFLMERSGRIVYAPVEAGVEADPILEALPLDEGTRSELWSRVDRLLVALDEVAGPDLERRRNVTREILGQLAAPPNRTD